MPMVKGFAEACVNRLEENLKTCDPSAVSLSSLCTKLTIKQEQDIKETIKEGGISISSKGEAMLDKINVLGEDFARRCKCTEK